MQECSLKIRQSLLSYFNNTVRLKLECVEMEQMIVKP